MKDRLLILIAAAAAGVVIGGCAMFWLLWIILFPIPAHASAAPQVELIHDDGRFAGSPLRDWFNGLASEKGPCCSNADGITIQDPDVDSVEGRYTVHICVKFQVSGADWGACKEKGWLPVPDDALVKEPNRFGPAVVWPYPNGNNETRVRCFLPGSGV